MEDKTIKVGDVVGITSEAILNDGNAMTVEAIVNDVATCVWYDSTANKYMVREFDLAILVLLRKKP